MLRKTVLNTINFNFLLTHFRCELIGTQLTTETLNLKIEMQHSLAVMCQNRMHLSSLKHALILGRRFWIERFSLFATIEVKKKMGNQLRTFITKYPFRIIYWDIKQIPIRLAESIHTHAVNALCHYKRMKRSFLHCFDFFSSKCWHYMTSSCKSMTNTLGEHILQCAGCSRSREVISIQSRVVS